MKSLGSSSYPPCISKLHGGGDMARRKKTQLKIGKVTYGERDRLEAFTAAFAPYFSKPASKMDTQKKAANE